jgi:catechol 1,2-dioxygenase
MKRRNFILNTALTAIAISTSGFVKFNGKNYEGDCETTTDILGPFYRPGSPMRNNLMIKGEAGDPVELAGFIRHKDCITPYKNAKVELWHCDVKGVYDNTSADFRFRGTTMTDENGAYSFQTIMPVSYGGQGFIRPAHFHLMITAAGYQPLVTQLYFAGDVHIAKDAYASAEKAKKRILNVNKKNGITKVNYDVSMSETLQLEAATIDKLTGIYKKTSDKTKTAELFKYDNTLWMKNEAFGNKFEYAGNNTFEEAGDPSGWYWTLQFEILPSGGIQLTESYMDVDLSKKVFQYLKEA